MTRLSSISAFFPAYNESENLEKMVDSLRSILGQVSQKFEIIIVDDGSQDATVQIADDLVRRYPGEVRVVHHPENRGYGAAVRSGITATRFDYVFFTDGDCQFDVSELAKLVPFIGDYDIVSGYRIHRADPLHRYLNSRGWNLLIRLILGVRVKDLNCAFKLYKGPLIRSLPLKSDGAMINTEVFYQAHERQLTLYEVPVTHLQRAAGQQTGANPKVIAKAFRELFQLLAIKLVSK